jgi:hypothetical protein
VASAVARPAEFGLKNRLVTYIQLLTYVTLHYITLHYIALHYITLHYINNQ